MGNNCCSEGGKTEMNTLEGNEDDIGGKPMMNSKLASGHTKMDSEFLMAYTSADKSKIVKI